MLREMMKSKLHKCVVTEANLDYEGSIGIDSNFLKMANMLPGEKVTVINLNNGARFETYIIEKPAGSKAIEINGGGARLCMKGDRLIVISYALYSEDELKNYNPIVLIMDEDNEVKECRNCRNG